MKKIIYIVLLLIVCFDLHCCDFETVKFNTDFSASRLNSCKMRNESSYLLTINAENYPVNNSPWYAFQVTSKQQKEISVSIQYIKGKHRYSPKISHDGKHWQSIPFKIRNKKLHFKLKLSPEPIWVAAQEIINNQVYVNWLNGLSMKSKKLPSILGKSTENRQISALESISDSNEWLILIGRMHPPETTGALALFSFSEEVFLNQNIGTKFRQRFNILLIPNLNPDGVELGNWRHNAKGFDLNRDWGKFKQQETQVVKKKFDQIIAGGGKIVFAVDFHSTYQDVFYTMPSDYEVFPRNIVINWLSELAEKLPDFKVNIKPGTSPGKGVFKQYIVDTYSVPAITYEMGDNTDRVLIRKVAQQAAKILMQLLIDTPQQNFKKKSVIND